MTVAKIVLITALLVNVSPAFAKNALPAFHQFPIQDSEQFSGTPASVDFGSYPGAVKFKNQLQQGAAKGPNYAGHYTIVTISCGKMCQDNWVIDAPSGKIVNRLSSKTYLSYQPDSTLLVVNPPNEVKRGYEKNPQEPVWGAMETTYEVLQNASFEVVQKNKSKSIVDWMSGGN